jgi:hypothetical protein
MNIEHDGKVLEHQRHLAVPYDHDEDRKLIIDNEGRATPKYGAVCKGRGNPRLFLDMWKLAFEQFLLYHDKPGAFICRKIAKEVATWRGLDEPQYMQRSLNNAQMWRVYENIPNRRRRVFL